MNINRRGFLVAATLGSFLPGLATAGTLSPFEDGAFTRAQESGKPILVHVVAPWCGTCKAQTPIVARLMAAPDFSGYEAFEVDFDTQKDVLRKFGVQRQSTMIVFKGASEVDRTLGETDPEAIEASLRKAL